MLYHLHTLYNLPKYVSNLSSERNETHNSTPIHFPSYHRCIYLHFRLLHYSDGRSCIRIFFIAIIKKCGASASYTRIVTCWLCGPTLILA